MLITIPYADCPRTFRIRFDTKILNQMKQIEEWRGYIKARAELTELNPDWSRDHAFREALSNVLLEGASVAVTRAEELVREGIVPSDKSEIEFVNYFELLQHMDPFAGVPGEKKLPIRESDVRQFHAAIVRGTMGDARQVGNYRKVEVHVVRVGEDGSEDILHKPPAAHEVAGLMRQFVEWLDTVANTRGEKLNALVTAALAHYEFVRIHPFTDGNGRTARFLTTLVLLQRGYDFRQLFCITEFYDRNRHKYTEAIGSPDSPSDYDHVVVVDGEKKVQTQTVYDLTTWLRFFLGGLSKQMKVAMLRMAN